MNCQVIDFVCKAEDLCTRCGGTGNEPQEELCCCCDHCFDEVLGWSTGIEPGTLSQEVARLFCREAVGTRVVEMTHEKSWEGTPTTHEEGK